MIRQLIASCFFMCVFALANGQRVNSDSLHNLIYSNANAQQRLNAAVKLSEYLSAKNNLNEVQPVALVGISLAGKTNNQKAIAGFKRDLGRVEYINGNYDSAATFFYQAITIYEKEKSDSGLASVWYEMGKLDSKIQKPAKALEDYNKALVFYKSTNNLPGTMESLNQMGTVYEDQKQYLKALNSYKASLEIAQSLKDTIGQSYCYEFIGYVFIDSTNKPEIAEEYLLKSLELRKIMHDTLAMAVSYINIGIFYDTIKQFDKATEALHHSIQLAKRVNYLELQKAALKELSNVYEGNNDYQQALQNFKKYKELNDSIYNDNSSKHMAELQTKYETEKKESEIKLLNSDKERQRTIIYSVCGGLVLLLALVFFVFRGYKQKQKANHELDIKNRKIEGAYKIIEEKNKDITDSIHYASRIQRALLTTDAYIGKHLKDYFILFKPKDIVSGDFYWVFNNEGTFYIACGDCTGHGVPGAFMSLLNISMLNETTIEKKIYRPAAILDDVREHIIKALNPEGADGGSKDGMDCVLCSFDFTNHKLDFACANNPLWIVRNNECIEFKPDKMPVGIQGEKNIPFNQHSTQLQKGDVVYIFTDGYADQFGGPKGKKFKYKQLQEKLLAIATKPMLEQKRELDTIFNAWKGDMEQVDDVLVIGIRV